MGNEASTGLEGSAEEMPENKSGVFLSEDLNNKIVQDFQSQVIREEWEKHQKYLLAKGNKRRLANFQATEAIQQKMATFDQQNDLVQTQLDQQIDDLKSKFADIHTAMEFDMERIDQKVAKITVKEQNEAPCLTTRTNVSLCLEKDGALNCSDFINAFEKCVESTIVSTE